MQKRNDDCIPVKDLVIGAVYRIDARNFAIGMWDGEAFLGGRYKFGNVFIDKEIHWDLDDHYGTAQPFELLVEPE